MARKKRILVVNDDGLHGEGLTPLREALASLGTVTAIVPERERSAASHCLTLHKPLRLKPHGPGLYAINGTPADCARIGVLHLMRSGVDLVVSGINRGHNMGQDVIYSGTVAAATEAAMLGVPAVAVSQGLKGGKGDYRAAAAFAVRLAKRLLAHPQKGILLNVNVPALPPEAVKGWKTVRLGERLYDQNVAVRRDPRGDLYFWMAGRWVRGRDVPGTDIAAVRAGYVSVTPLSLDPTDVAALPKVAAWRF